MPRRISHSPWSPAESPRRPPRARAAPPPRSRHGRSGPARPGWRAPEHSRWPRTACKRVAGRAALVPIVDEQRDAAMRGEERGDAPTRHHRGRAKSRRSRRRGRMRARRPRPMTRRSIPPTCWRTGSASRNSLATSSSGCAGKLVDRCRARWASGTACAAASRSTGLVSTKWTSPRKPAARSTRSASRGKRPAARPELGIDRVRRRARALPAIGERGADQLAEHLADLRRGREIAARAERVAGRVIISVAGFHIGLDGDRPFGRDALAKRPLERGHAHLPLAEAQQRCVPTVGSTRTRRFFAVSISHRPPRIIGSDSHWPMCRCVAWAKPISCWSGSRMNSMPKRKQP